MTKATKKRFSKKSIENRRKPVRKASRSKFGSRIIRETGVAYLAKSHSRSNKTIDETWDFRKSNTKEYTHCFHAYPAMMIPQVARRIIENYGKSAKTLFDPYCGTGKSLFTINLVSIIL